MTEQEITFHRLGKGFPDSLPGQLFGKPCYQKNGRTFICFFQNEMVFKLKGSWLDAARTSEGSRLFDPSGKGRPMKEWVQVADPSQWQQLSEAAYSLQ